MTKEKLEDLKQRINKHFFNELLIMKDFAEANLTKAEIRELNSFMTEHPYGKVVSMLEDRLLQCKMKK